MSTDRHYPNGQAQLAMNGGVGQSYKVPRLPNNSNVGTTITQQEINPNQAGISGVGHSRINIHKEQVNKQMHPVTLKTSMRIKSTDVLPSKIIGINETKQNSQNVPDIKI